MKNPVIKELEGQGYTVEKASVNWNVVTAPIQDKIICGAVWFSVFVLPYIIIWGVR